MTLAHRVAVMNKGVIEQLGTPKEIYNNPRTLFVAGFIGSPPMNLIDGEVKNGVFTGAGAAGRGLRPRQRRACGARRPPGGRSCRRRQGRRHQPGRADLFGRTHRREHAGQRAVPATASSPCAPTRISSATSIRDRRQGDDGPRLPVRRGEPKSRRFLVCWRGRSDRRWRSGDGRRPPTSPIAGNPLIEIPAGRFRLRQRRRPRQRAPAPRRRAARRLP